MNFFYSQAEACYVNASQIVRYDWEDQEEDILFLVMSNGETLLAWAEDLEKIGLPLPPLE